MNNEKRDNNFDTHRKSLVWSTIGYSETITRDQAGRIIEMKLMNGATVKAGTSWTYNSDGNLLTWAGLPLNHDSLGRLVQDRGPSGGTTTYAYDDKGNRTSITRGGVMTTNVFAPVASDRLSSQSPASLSYGYDLSGNVTTRGFGGATETITVGDEGLVSSINHSTYGTTNYGRDWLGHRLTVAGAGGAGTWFFTPDGEPISWEGPATQLPCSYQSCSIILGVMRCFTAQSQFDILPYETYATLGDFRVAVVKSHLQTPATCGATGAQFFVDGPVYYFQERENVPVAAYSGYGANQGLTLWNADFDAFGTPFFVNDDYQNTGKHLWVPFRMPGQMALSVAEGGPTSSAGGLHENWHRIYDSVSGRYLEPDPLFNPLNAYGYAYSMPAVRAS